MNILIVDDSKLNLQMAKNIIEENKLDCEIALCNSGNEALEYLNGNKVDIILLDIVMPGLSGIDVLKKIKSNDEFKDIQIIMFTSITRKEALKESFENGAVDFVNKPIEPTEFIARIKSAMRERKYKLSLKENLDVIANQNEELVKLNKELKETQYYLVQKEKLIAIGQLAAGVAHEINNPLGFVSSNTETLSKYIEKFKRVMKEYNELVDTIDDKGISNGEITSKIEEIKNNQKKLHIDFIIEDLDILLSDTFKGIDRVKKIVESLRNFARQDDQKESSYHSINDIIEETLLLTKNESKYTIDIRKHLEEIPNILCNKTQIGQVLLNVIMNAVQAINGENREERGQINIYTSKDQDYITCKIIDNGPGIEKEVLDKIFNPFFTTKEIGKGTGLGLSISYDIIVNKHKGDITVDSEVGKGTMFKIKLPINRNSEDS